jgi:hypothetical protein
MTIRKLRIDALPENYSYRDDGCDIHPACLTCPLPQCRYDNPRGARGMFNEVRDVEIVRLRRKGLSINEIASRYDISRRTVFRVMRRSVEVTSVNTERLSALDVFPLLERKAG